MFKSAKLLPLLDRLEERPAPRGAPERVLNADDLIAFGRCPARWLRSPDSDDPLLERGPSFTEWLAFRPEAASAFFAERPESYDALILRCPACNSKGPGKLCRRCGLTRRHVVEPRPWSNAATVCAEWTAQHEAAGRRPISATTWRACADTVNDMALDPAIHELAELSDKLVHIRGVWHDDDTRLNFPVEARITLLPAEGCRFDNAIVNYTETRNGDPVAWRARLLTDALHLRAALALLLLNTRSETIRSDSFWIVVEKDPPRIVSRRSLGQDVLTSGRESLFALLGAYARCLHTGGWPAFEDPAPCLAARV